MKTSRFVKYLDLQIQFLKYQMKFASGVNADIEETFEDSSDTRYE